MSKANENIFTINRLIIIGLLASIFCVVTIGITAFNQEPLPASGQQISELISLSKNSDAASASTKIFLTGNGKPNSNQVAAQAESIKSINATDISRREAIVAGFASESQ